MRLYPEEPEAGPWRRVADVQLADRVRALLPDEQRVLIFVDGRTVGRWQVDLRRAAGETARRCRGDTQATVRGTTTRSTGGHPRSTASSRRGAAGRQSPSGHRAGSPMDGTARSRCRRKPVLIVEGVGTGRAALAPCAELIMWIQSDHDRLAGGVSLGTWSSAGRRRRRRRSGTSGCEPSSRSSTAERPWSRASLVVNWTPPVQIQTDTFSRDRPAPLLTVDSSRALPFTCKHAASAFVQRRICRRSPAWAGAPSCHRFRTRRGSAGHVTEVA